MARILPVPQVPGITAPLPKPPVDAPTPPLDPAQGDGAKPGTEHFVMCPPVYISTAIPNNVFMEGDNAEPVDKPRALRQYARVKHLLEALGATVLEIPPMEGAQDQTFTANIGVAIAPYIILANYKAPGRDVEVEPARQFFTSLGYQVIQPPFHFEGEADLKRLNDQTYIGGYGKFSDIRAHQWIAQQTGVNIVAVREISDELYHLDCSLMPLDEENVLASRDGLDAQGMQALARIANVIEVPKGLAAAGVTNGVKVTDKRIYLSGTLQPEEENYRDAMEFLLETMDAFGYTVVFVDTDAVNPSGADLSCQTMRLTFPPTPTASQPAAAPPPSAAPPTRLASLPAPSAPPPAQGGVP